MPAAASRSVEIQVRDGTPSRASGRDCGDPPGVAWHVGGAPRARRVRDPRVCAWGGWPCAVAGPISRWLIAAFAAPDPVLATLQVGRVGLLQRPSVAPSGRGGDSETGNVLTA